MTLPLYPALVENSVHYDVRGSHRKFFGKTPEKIEVPGFEIKEVFMTTNNKNTIRGMHFQSDVPQPKIIKLITGPKEGLLVRVLCCDETLPEFGEVREYNLTVETEERLYVPGKWALGYRALEDYTKVLYLAGADFSPGGDTGIDPFDTELPLNWGITKEEALLSPRDLELESFSEFARKVGR